MDQRYSIRADDLDEATIYLYRIWARVMLGEEPEALVLKEPEYILIGRKWVLYCSRVPANETEVSLIRTDTGKPVICAAPALTPPLDGLDVEKGSYRGHEAFRPIIEALTRASAELPPAAKQRDPPLGRWITHSIGTFEIWLGRQARLICVDSGGAEFGYTWDTSQDSVYAYRSKSCKREGRKLFSGGFKMSEQKREQGKSYWNIDLLTDSGDKAALIRLTPAGAGYKVFSRQLPKSFKPIPVFYE